MDAVDRIGAALVREHDVRSLEDLDVPAVELEGLDFIGAKDHWGSVGLVGLVRSDALDAEAITARAATFAALTKSLHHHARVLTVFTTLGSANVKLGSFGVLCFVFERGCSKELAAHVRGQRSGSASKQEYTLAWSADVASGKVHDHGLLPRGVFPSKRWMEGVLRDRGVV